MKRVNDLSIETRKDFPLFCKKQDQESNLIYLDHAATRQKTIQVIEALKKYYSFQNANVHI